MNEDQLTLYYYGDGLTDGQRRAVAQTLAQDPQLAARYAQLGAELDSLASSEEQLAPPHLAARWHHAIDRAAAADARIPTLQRFGWFNRWIWGGALAASLALGIAIGVSIDGDDIRSAVGPGAVVQNEDGSALSTSAFARGLMVYFQDSRSQLLNSTENGEGRRRQLILELLRQNRLFAKAATHSDADDLARVLRAFEPLLIRLSEEQIPALEAEALQAQLGFELDIVLTKLSRNVSDKPATIDI